MYCVSMVTMVTRTCHSAILYVQYIAVLLYASCGDHMLNN